MFLPHKLTLPKKIVPLRKTPKWKGSGGGAKPPVGTALFKNLLGNGLTPRAHMGDRAPPQGPLEGALEAGGAPTRGLTFVIQVLFFCDISLVGFDANCIVMLCE